MDISNAKQNVSGGVKNTSQGDMYDKLVQENISKVPSCLITAFNCVSESLKYNGSWGFIVNTDTNYKDSVESLRGIRSDASCQKLGITYFGANLRNGYLIVLSPKVMKLVVDTIAPGLDIIDEVWMKVAVEKSEKAKQDCIKFLYNLVEGKDKRAWQVGNTLNILCGLYCLNEMNSIREGGKDYPAFKIAFPDFCKIVNSIGLGNNIAVVSDVGVVPIAKINNTQLLKDIFKSIVIGESRNGLIVKLVVIPKNK